MCAIISSQEHRRACCSHHLLELECAFCCWCMPPVTSAYFLFFFCFNRQMCDCLKEYQFIYKKINQIPHRDTRTKKVQNKTANTQVKKKSFPGGRKVSCNQNQKTVINYSYNDIHARIFLNDVECSYNPRIIMRRIITVLQVSHH